MLWTKETHGIWGAHRRAHLDYISRIGGRVFWEALPGKVSFNVRNYKQIVTSLSAHSRKRKIWLGSNPSLEVEQINFSMPPFTYQHNRKKKPPLYVQHRLIVRTK